MTSKTPQQIITLFEQYVDDATELSSAQELALCQKIYNKVWTDRPWEFAKASASGTFALTVPHIPKPADFSNFVENNQSTDNSMGIENNATAKVIYIGSSCAPYQIVNWSDRRAYRNKNGYAYLDLPNSGITLTGAPTAPDTYEFDYKTQPPTLSLNTPITGIPAEFQEMLYHGMASDHDIILLFPRANSYAQENIAKYNSYLSDMRLWNANLQAN
jgi:hypothetical protein